MNEIVKERYERVRLVNIFQYETNNTARMLRDLILKDESGVTKEESELINQSRLNAGNAIETLKHLVEDEEVKKLITELDYLNQSYNEANSIIFNHLYDGRKDLATTVLIDEYRDVRLGLVQNYEKLTAIEEQAMNKALEDSRKIYNWALNGILYLIFGSFLIGIGITLWVINSVTSSIQKVTSVMTNIADHKKGNLPRIQVKTDDEIGKIAIAYNGMAQSLEEYIKQENELKEKMQEENWLKTNLAELTAKFQGIQDVQDFARLFITKITPLIEASYGIFYIKNEKRDELCTIATYASNNVEFGSTIIHFGEGLVGQAALENKAILLDAVPENYMKIKSGLGSASPAHLYIVPIEYEGKVIAVIEIGSFKPFLLVYQQLLHQVLAIAGININSIIGHMKIGKLLTESQALTEELQSQSEELQQQQEELRMINEQLEEQYKHSEQKTKELEKIKLDLEKKNYQVEQSSKYKTEFLANMSHELRTPLNSMLILSQLLAENNEKNLSVKQIEYANTIHSSGKDLLYLIHDILDLSKIEAGKMQILLEEIPLSEIEHFVKQQFTPIAQNKGIDFQIKIDTDLSNKIYTDIQKLKQILKNLLSNAFKFTTNGQVVFQIQKTDKKLGKSKKSLLALSVMDTGIGIPKEKQPFIFEAFNQVDGTTSRQYGGTGLGLSISKNFAQLLGGFIEFTSVEGEGSTFTLYLLDSEMRLENSFAQAEIAATLPEESIIIKEEINESASRNEDEKHQLNEQQNVKESLAGKKVLIVDDDMRNIFSLTTALEMNHMQVVFAENGKEAIEILQSQADIDLVLMDIMMPVMNGYEAIEVIRQIETFKTLPIIAVTAKAMKNDREKCLEAGATDYISKPVNLEQLLSLIRVWLYR